MKTGTGFLKAAGLALIAVMMCVTVQIKGQANEVKSTLTADMALARLKEGNQRYFNNHRIYPNTGKARRTETSEKGQYPYATILGCSDSRVPLEHVFDAGIGDIFVVRVAGNVCGVDEMGSIEYGTEHLGTPVLVVLGHTKCGAVTAVARGDTVHGNIETLVERILPAVKKAKKMQGDEFTPALLDASIKLNVWQSIEEMFHESEIVTGLVKEGKLRIVGAVYNLESGKVDWLGEHPDQKALVGSGS